jgi:hypothetical protein
MYFLKHSGNQPASTPPIKSAPNFTFIPTLGNQFLLQTTANIPFTEATNIARNMFLNKEYEVRGSSVKIKDIKVYGVDDKVMIERNRRVCKRKSVYFRNSCV